MKQYITDKIIAAAIAIATNVETKKVELTDKQKKIQEIFDKCNFQCQKSHVAELLELLCGFKPVVEQPEDYKPFAIYKKDNNTVIYIYSGYGIDLIGYHTVSKSWKQVTGEKAVTFINTMKEKLYFQIETVLGGEGLKSALASLEKFEASSSQS